ncbi:DUF4369 domain-containing protein [Formosa haliotis]|uniref:DUF4369 domain-containing protein n=1 Tax=Formosa haliotis TaxID=1555194 RepID=UPI000825ADA9|nr:DUF4369 domain-containing protein [Formosa haliotis]
MKFLKLFLALLIVTGFIFTSCKSVDKPDGYIISGTVNGLDSGWVKLIKPRVLFTDSIIVLDSTEIKNGKFSFKGKVDNVDMIQVSFSPRLNTYFF